MEFELMDVLGTLEQEVQVGILSLLRIPPIISLCYKILELLFLLALLSLSLLKYGHSPDRTVLH